MGEGEGGGREEEKSAEEGWGVCRDPQEDTGMESLILTSVHKEVARALEVNMQPTSPTPRHLLCLRERKS